MKIKSKALLLTLCAALLVVASVLTTLSYLTDTKKVENVFTVGNVKITLDELKVDEYGKEMVKVTCNGEEVFIKREDIDAYEKEHVGCEIEQPCRVIANEYKLIPGHTYIKDPTIHILADSIDCYLFVTVDNAIADIEDDTTIAAQMETLGWGKVAGYTNVYAYYGVAAEGQPAPTALKKIDRSESVQDFVVFKTFKIKGDQITATDLAKYKTETDETKPDNGNKVVVNAYAVQAEGFEGKTAIEVWEVAFSGKGIKETSSTPVEETTPAE